MTRTRLDVELPYRGGNAPALRAELASEFAAVSESDISILANRGHPDAYSDKHVVGLIFDVDPSNVSQSAVDTAMTNIRNLLGTNARELGWGAHDPDYLGDYREEEAV